MTSVKRTKSAIINNLLTIIQVSLVQILLLDSYRTARSVIFHRLPLVVALHWRSCSLPKASLTGHIQAWIHRDTSLVAVPSYDEVGAWIWPNGRCLT